MPGKTPDGRLWYSINEAAAVACVSRRTIYNWLKERKLEILRTPSGAARIAADCLLRRDAA